MSNIFRDFFVKEKPVFTGISRGIGGFSYGISAAESDSGAQSSVSGGARFTVPDAPGYTYHIFNDIHSGANFVNDSTLSCDILVVGGGGSGGSDVSAGAAGGGGGGAVVYYPGVSLSAGTYAVQVGKGGENLFTAYSDYGASGGNSVFAGPQSGPWPSPFALVALGGGGGAQPNPGSNSNHAGNSGGCGGGGSSDTGDGGISHYIAPNPQSLPSNSITYGHGGDGRDSPGSPSNQRGGGGGGAGGPSAPTSPHSVQGQGARSGYEVPSTFLPTSCPSDFANMIGGAHPSSQGGAIGTPSPEWRYFGGGGGGSDNHSQPQGDGGLGGGGNAGFAADTSPWPLMARTANPHPNTTTWGLNKTMAPGVGGRGGGGAGNGSDSPSPQIRMCHGGSGGSGCVIIKAQYTVSDSFAATGGTNQPNGIVSGSYTYHVFADDGNFVVASGSKSIDFLIVAGGGGGANGQGGGGGAGGVVYGTSVYIGKGTYPVVVGAGGGGAGPGTSTPGSKGSDSKFGGLTAIGGGGGAQNNWGHPGGNPTSPSAGPYPSSDDNSRFIVGGSSGGCGGGTKSGAPGPDLQAQYPYMQTPNRGGTTMYNNITQYGNAGGAQGNAASGAGGGGGGAGGEGGGSYPGNSNGGGGQPFPAFPGPVLSPGMPSPQQSAFATAVGTSGEFGGGGGGGYGGGGGGSYGNGGPGGGGQGGSSTPDGGDNGVAGTGGGGGGSGNSGPGGGDGGKGVVIIRYLT